MREGLAAMVAVPDVQLILHLLETEPDTTRRDDLLRDTLKAAWAEASRRLVRGQLNQSHFECPLSRFGPALVTQQDTGPAPGGGQSRPQQQWLRASDFRVISGLSWRMAPDVGDWDRNFSINSPDRSGDPDSPHDRDLFPLRARHQSVPLLFSRAAVDAAAEHRLSLRRAA